jgi:uncharacterized RDD family membrane protein YckC
MNSSNHYFLRLLARLIDLLLVGLIVQAAHIFDSRFGSNPPVWFLIYNAVAIIFNGKTLGKYSFSLSVKSQKRGLTGIARLLIRELLILVLLPILVFNVLFVSPLPLHDRICGTKVIRDER